MDVPNLWPEGCKLLIEVDMVQETTGGGIILPPSARENQQRSLQIGTVLRLGPDVTVRLEGGKTLSPGKKIIFAKYGGYNLNLQEISGDNQRVKRDLRILNDEDVIAVLD